jgi:hypothetical protein
MTSRHVSRHPPPELRDLTETSVLSRPNGKLRDSRIGNVTLYSATD